jgi:hypothetical protein
MDLFPTLVSTRNTRVNLVWIELAENFIFAMFTYQGVYLSIDYLYSAGLRAG